MARLSPQPRFMARAQQRTCDRRRRSTNWTEVSWLASHPLAGDIAARSDADAASDERRLPGDTSLAALGARVCRVRSRRCDGGFLAIRTSCRSFTRPSFGRTRTASAPGSADGQAVPPHLWLSSKFWLDEGKV